ncbi:hypothetical protein JYU34_016864 [Plutella xylostella]|uniref:Uncharacterized protein n=1 Tax=Plutella xylostella TaxID=51655 RepID=A0ABQ7Q3N1_PLUXY|nr:hypothetical protein JYU34_016864 [Plutella xylostella]
MGRERRRLNLLRVSGPIPQQQPGVGRAAAARCAAGDLHHCARARRVPTLLHS